MKNLLQLDSISLLQFKNYVSRQFRFDSRIVAIGGPNGVGKTNLLDAVYYLCFTKSYFGRTDIQNVHAGMKGFRIEGKFTPGSTTFSPHGEDSSMVLPYQGSGPREQKGEPQTVVCIVRENGKKEFSMNDEAYERFADHVGKIPCVIVVPDDVRIITEGSEERRRFIDALLSQLSPEYLQRLINYNKILQQRNSYLKSIAESRSRDLSLIEVYDQQLINDGEFIFNRRKSFLSECITSVKEFYRNISGTDELIELKYESQLLTTPYAGLMKNLREKDILLQRTNGGIHKDDIQILINEQPFKNMASQGQRKSLLFALKLTEFRILQESKGFAPLLLLDDVFEKLDEGRMHNLLEWVCVRNEGQIFITDTHPDRIVEHFERLEIDYQLINV